MAFQPETLHRVAQPPAQRRRIGSVSFLL